ncbi:MAG: hypothetical protein IJ374_01120 [Lachnospiraceae bacterium]|nr:hypothetical protein [Lachnospiraceae bacterium]
MDKDKLTKEETFEFTYSAKRQEEIEKIRKKYLPAEEDKMEQLRKLDKSTTKLGTVYALILGVVGTLMLGIGMCCTMVWAEQLFVPGIGIGLLGIFLIVIAYPVYARTTKKQREKLAPQILALTEELSK